ncbi:cytochrome p450 [Diplodia corticola]|uniref:Cytochrome p450 n=1 Tax=Diplodia corticola TaxID=236234 RepID=A0A1J9R3Q0_9PEZI|nr:cytochrome p450 [Diplodia corticola]OJD36070.1 cytochrome p450 [Diplodia corticola]
MDSLDCSAHPSLILAAGLLLAYLAYGAVYRLCLSPVAHFPGPRLAALTFWYEFYYDVLCSGRYTWRIAEMHKTYGPVVRINPYELHVNVPDFYDTLYASAASGRRTEKWRWSAKMFGTTQAAVGTASHELHRLRRAALNPFFSRRSVVRLEPVIQANVDKLRARLHGFAATGQHVNLTDAFTALSADVIGAFAFGKPYGFLDADDFNPGWHKLMLDLSRGTHLMKQFGWLYTILTCIPQRLVSIIHPLTKELFDVQNGITAQIEEIKASKTKNPSPSDAPPTILHDLLANPNSRLPPPELATPRLTEEAFTLLGAGTVTTAHTLSTTLYHLLANPSKLSRLRSELAPLYLPNPNPNPSSPNSSSPSPSEPPPPPTWTRLERLPYLSAVLAEGLRLSYGVSHRLPRLSPDAPLRVVPGGAPEAVATIPPGTPVSMTQMFLHDDASIFPEPAAFWPERWLLLSEGQEEEGEGEGEGEGDRKEATEGGEATERERELARMRRFLVPFSRGTRQCVGMNLAYAEMVLALAALARPGLRLELWETGVEDVRVAHDWFNPAPRAGSKGVRVLVRTEEEGFVGENGREEEEEEEEEEKEACVR